MNRILTLIWFCFAAISGLALYGVKYEVKSLEEELVELNNKIYENREAITVLKTEWTFLNDPRRLKRINEQFFGMNFPKPEQIQPIHVLPFKKMDAKNNYNTDTDKDISPVNYNSTERRTISQ